MHRVRPSSLTPTISKITNGSTLACRLIPATGDLKSANNELRWIKEHCQRVAPASQQDAQIEEYVARRSKGEPLQYILGSTFYGDLELKCRPGVFIPRAETAASVSYLVDLVLDARKLNERGGAGESNVQSGTPSARKHRRGQKSKPTGPFLRVFDLCSGSGCIPLLFWQRFYTRFKELGLQKPCFVYLAGFDASPDALELARDNSAALKTEFQQEVSQQSLCSLRFMQVNVLKRNNSPVELSLLPTARQAIGEYWREETGKKGIARSVTNNDIWISNPPYISEQGFNTTTSASVRDFEPKLALVPPETIATINKRATQTGHDADRFYEDIIYQAMELRVNVLLFEVSDMEQAKRVAKFATERRHWYLFEIWRDNPTHAAKEYMAIHDQLVSLRGVGEGRSVLLATQKGAKLLGHPDPESRSVRTAIRKNLNHARRRGGENGERGSLKGRISEEREKGTKSLVDS